MASIVHIGQIDKAVKSQPRKKSRQMDVEPHKVRSVVSGLIDS